MRQWECGSVCPCAPIRFFYFLLNPGACRGTYAARARQPTGSEGRTLHAATSPFTGIRQCVPKAKELTPRKDGGMRNLGRGGIRRLTERGRDCKFKSCRFLIPATQERLTGPEKGLDARLSWRRKRWHYDGH